MVWVQLHPTLSAVGTAGEVEVTKNARLELFTDNGVFAIIVCTGGLFLSLMFLASQRQSALGLVEIGLGLAVTAAYSSSVWMLGLGLDRFMRHGVAAVDFPPETLADGERVVAALGLDTLGCLVLPCLVWALVCLGDAVIGARRRA